MTTKAEIAEWFERGRANGDRYMAVVRDTFDHSDYPKYFADAKSCLEHKAHPGGMQRIMETYDLTDDLGKQLAEARADNGPKGREEFRFERDNMTEPPQPNPPASLHDIHRRRGTVFIEHRYDTIEVCRADEPAVIEYLRPRWDHMKRLWEPLA